MPFLGGYLLGPVVFNFFVSNKNSGIEWTLRKLDHYIKLCGVAGMVDPNLRDYILLKHVELIEAKYGFEIQALNTGFYFVTSSQSIWSLFNSHSLPCWLYPYTVIE